MPGAVDLSHAFGLEPRAAVDYFRSKGYALGFNWEAMAVEAHARAFTVAKVMNMDVLQSIREELDRALAGGLTLEQFKANLEPRLKALGWWGKQVVEGPSGSAQIVNVSTPHRLETIYRTNLQSSYMAGRFRQFMDNVDDRPWFEYVAVMDNRTRPAHAAMNGRIFRFDDPIWDTCWPPNGYNCRCRVRALTDAQAQAKGVSISGDNLKRFSDTDPQTGEVFDRVAYKAPGMSVPFSPDRGFAGNQAIAASVSEVDAGTKAQVLGDGADAALADITSRSWSAWTAWVDDLFRDAQSAGTSRVLGYAQDPERAFLQAQGAKFATGALEVDGALLAGRDAQLPVNQWKALPLLLADREAVLFDAEARELLYVARQPGETQMRTVVSVAADAKGQARDAVTSARPMALADLRAGVASGRYTIVSGDLA